MTYDLKDFVEQPLASLIEQADDIRRRFIGNRLELCSIMNAKSGRCTEDCCFCAQSGRHNAQIEIYPLRSMDQILSAAENAKSVGSQRFSLVTSGNSLSQSELDLICKAYEAIRTKIGIELCASFGALNAGQLSALKDAGMTRYHHNIETARGFYSSIVSTHDFDQRIRTIETARSLGLDVCSGGIIGMGETWADRLDMAITLRDLDVDSVPLNILIPINGTPLGDIESISCVDVVRTIAMFRIVLRDKTIRIVAGRDTVFKDFQALGFLAGANAMMVGGYLTTQGRDVTDDVRLAKEILRLWTK